MAPMPSCAAIPSQCCAGCQAPLPAAPLLPRPPSASAASATAQDAVTLPRRPAAPRVQPGLCHRAAAPMCTPKAHPIPATSHPCQHQFGQAGASSAMMQHPRRVCMAERRCWQPLLGWAEGNTRLTPPFWAHGGFPPASQRCWPCSWVPTLTSLASRILARKAFSSTVSAKSARQTAW